MNTNHDKSTTNLHGLELEYNSLRNEILKRFDLRQQFISITLTLAGIFLSFGLTTDLIALIYPPIATFLALGWAQNDLRVRDLGNYIRENIETVYPGIGYETHVQLVRNKAKGVKSLRPLVISHSGIFLFTQLMAVGIELSKSTSLAFSPLKWALLSIDLIAIIIVIWIAAQTKR
jgi:hypothetical protein